MTDPKEEPKDTPFEPREYEVFFSWTDKDGKEQHACNEEIILAKLLIDNVLFCNTRPYVGLNPKTWKGYGDYSNIEPETIVLFVNANDVFVWGSADAETITAHELPDLYRMHMADKKWGSLKWVCKKANLQPQGPIIRDMKKDGSWCDLMESLPKNK